MTEARDATGSSGAGADDDTDIPIFQELSAWFLASSPPPPAGPTPDRFATAADEGWRAVAAVAEAPPAETTAAGLPCRRPMAHHIPGSAGSRTADSAERVRDAASVRRHLSAYQRGLREGRRRTGAPPDGIAPGPATPRPQGVADHGDGRPRR